jgi:hypothetical protein
VLDSQSAVGAYVYVPWFTEHNHLMFPWVCILLSITFSDCVTPPAGDFVVRPVRWRGYWFPINPQHCLRHLVSSVKRYPLEREGARKFKINLWRLVNMLPTRLQGLSASRRLVYYLSSLIVCKESRSLRTCTQYTRLRYRRKKCDKRLFFEQN